MSSPRSGRTIALAAIILLIIKQFVIGYIYGDQLIGLSFDQTFFHYLGFIASDFMVLGIILFLVFFNLFIQSRLLKLISNIINIVLLILFFVDIITIYYFQSRLSILDLYSFFSVSNGSYFFFYIAGIVAVFFACFVVLFLFVQKYFKRTQKRNKLMALSLWFFIFSIFFSFINFISSTNKDIQENVVFLNIKEISNSIGENKEFSSLANIKLRKNYENYFRYIQGENKKLNVIIVFAESFSTVDSLRAGGLYDNFPFFDKIQSEGTTYTNFMANGCTSETAHIALLQGVEPRQNPIEKSDASYYKFANYTPTLPDFFNSLGYQTTFLSTAPLDFLDQRDYIAGLNFQTIIGEEAFKKEKKYVFNAAPDNVLYNKALQLVESGIIDISKPLFLVMQTVSSHKPYDTPLGKSKEAMFKYVDRTNYAFYQKLKKIGFFDNGLLVIVGDHRKMEAIPTVEFKKYGMTSHSRAMAAIIGSGIQANIIDDNIIQHLDIFYSLKYLAGSGKILVNKDFNNVFVTSQETRDRGVRYCRFSEKHYVVLKKDNEAYTLRPGMDPYIQDYITAYKKFQYKQLIGKGFDSDYFDNFSTWSGYNSDFIIIAHRGDPSEAVDNSMKGFQLAKENRANGIEFDVSLTKDGENVIYHGPTLVSTTCSPKQNIYDYNLADLQTKCKLKNGETIMTLEDMFSQTKGRFDYYFVEIKVYDPAKAEKQTLDAIDTVIRLGMQDRVIFTSYDKTANYIIGSYKGINAAWDTYNSGNINIVGKFPHQYFMMPYDLIDDEVVKTAQQLNKKVVVYTINDQAGFDQAYNLGIKIIMTDNVPFIEKLIKAKKIDN